MRNACVLAILIAMCNACASEAGGSSPGSSSNADYTAADVVSGSDSSASAEVSTPAKKCILDQSVEGEWNLVMEGVPETFKSDVVFDSVKCQITTYEFGKTKNEDHELFTADPWNIQEKTPEFIKVVFPGDPPYTLTRPVQ